MNKETVTKSNLQKRIDDLKAFIKYNQKVKDDTERLLKQVDITGVSEIQLQHLENKINTCEGIIELHNKEIQDLEGLL